ANALCDQARHAEAVPHYDRVITALPHHAAARYNRGCALLQLARPGAALDDFDAVIGHDAHFALAHSGRAHALYDLERYPAANASIEQALALSPASIDAQVLAGRILIALKDSAGALLVLERILEAQPERLDALLNRGVALKELGRPDEAIAAFDA